MEKPEALNPLFTPQYLGGKSRLFVSIFLGIVRPALRSDQSQKGFPLLSGPQIQDQTVRL
jgi:hypothetical protein